jgi:hypothetical protein
MTDTAVVATYVYRHEAEFARETLRASGIESVLAGDDAGGAYGPLTFARGIRLLVRSDEADRAREILADEDLDGTTSGPAAG